MKRPEQHQIDELAQRVFRNSLPASWVINDQYNDYGKDYLVEIANDSNELTGTTFYVQLKGQKEVRLSRDKKFAKFRLESKHARYYAEQVTDIPVFLVVVDTSIEKGHWLFLQSYLENEQSWRNKKGFTVNLPTKNKLDDPAVLEKAVVNASSWLRARHPSAIPDAISAYQNKLEKLDPRFGVSVSYRDGGVHAWIAPRKEPVSVRLKLTGEPDAITEKLMDLVERGRKVRLEDGEYEFEGSSLFTAHGPGPVEIQWASTHQGTVTVILFDDEKNEIARVDEIAGSYSEGMAELRFVSAMPRLPMYVETPALNTSGGSLNFKFLLAVWDALPILHLPYFEKIQGFLQALDQAKYLKTEFTVEGISFAASQLSTIHLPNASAISQVVGSLVKARKIFQSVGLNPIWSLSHFTEDFFDTVNLAHAVLFGAGFSKRLPDHSFEFEVSRSTFNHEALTLTPNPAVLTLTSEPKAVILDQEISLGVVTERFTDVVLQQISSDNSSEVVGVKVVTTPSTVHSMCIEKGKPHDVSNPPTTR